VTNDDPTTSLSPPAVLPTNPASALV
jgi:hypothetical protein